MRILHTLATKFIRPGPVFLCIFFMYVLGFFSHAIILKKTVYGDGIFYYSWLRSVIIDRDMNFQNEYDYFDMNQPTAITGLPSNKYAIGPALLWAPAYLTVHTFIKGTGYEWPYQFAIGCITVLYCVASLFFLYRMLLFVTNQTTALLTILAISFSTNLLFYGSLDPVNSHGLSFFTAVIFLTMLLSNHVPGLFKGIALGFVGLMRPQDLIFIICAIPFLSVSTVVPFMEGIGIAFFPQLIVWFVQTGNMFINPYMVNNEGYSLLRPQLFSVLFNTSSGLFFYTPIIFIALFGFLASWKKFNRIKLFFFITFLVQLYLISSWSTSSQGASYSGRMFVSVLPIVAMALSFVISKFVRLWGDLATLLILVLPLSTTNILLIIYYLATH